MPATKFSFTKMHGLGNDFIVIDAINQAIELTPIILKKLANRHTGIGFDQCLLIEKSKQTGVDFFYRIFNANGQEVGQCGNGARCLARFAKYYGLTEKNNLTIATHTTQMHLQINPDDSVTVDFGKPKLAPHEIPLIVDPQDNLYTIPLTNGSMQNLHAVNVGNPHAVIHVNDVTFASVAQLGAEIEKHPLFPEKTNVGFMEVVNSEQIKLRVFERGCGETNACGSGAVAAAAIGRLFYQLAPTVRVTLLGGELIVTWKSFEESLYLTGPAEFVYEGKIK